MVDESVVKIIQKYRGLLVKSGVPVSNVILFGSHVKDHNHTWSDIDLLVVSPRFDGKRKRQDINVLWRIAAQVDSRFPRSGGIGDLIDVEGCLGFKNCNLIEVEVAAGAGDQKEAVGAHRRQGQAVVGRAGRLPASPGKGLPGQTDQFPTGHVVGKEGFKALATVIGQGE